LSFCPTLDLELKSTTYSFSCFVDLYIYFIDAAAFPFIWRGRHLLFILLCFCRRSIVCISFLALGAQSTSRPKTVSYTFLHNIHSFPHSSPIDHDHLHLDLTSPIFPLEYYTHMHLTACVLIHFLVHLLSC